MLSKLVYEKEELDVIILTSLDEYENLLLKYNKFQLVFCGYKETDHIEKNYFLPDTLPKLGPRLLTKKIYLLNFDGYTGNKMKFEHKLAVNETVCKVFSGSKVEFISEDHKWMQYTQLKDYIAVSVYIISIVLKVLKA